MLELISLVGVDQHTKLDKLVDMDLRFVEATSHLDNPPFCEFGFLFSEQRSKTDDPRYPPLDFIKKSMQYLNSEATSTSIHLCGIEAVTRYLNADNEIIDMCHTSRVQLNFLMKNYNEDELIENLLEVSNKHFMALVVQCNKSKQKFIDKLVKRIKQEEVTDSTPNINILYDGSGGFGRVIEEINAPFEGILTGYAGGLNPDNILSVLNNIQRKIVSVNPDWIAPYYIDMESGVRTDNLFDLSKCQLVLDEVMKFNLQQKMTTNKNVTKYQLY